MLAQDFDQTFSAMFGGRKVLYFYASVPAELPLKRKLRKLRRRFGGLPKPSKTAAVLKNPGSNLQPFLVSTSEYVFKEDLQEDPLVDHIKREMATIDLKLHHFIGMADARGLQKVIDLILPRSLHPNTLVSDEDPTTNLYYLPCKKGERFIIAIFGHEHLPH